MEWWQIVLLFLALSIEPLAIYYFFYRREKTLNKENTTYSEDNDNE